MPRISELDGLRAILAFWVLLVHVSKAVYDVDTLPLANIIYNENTRVKVFFIISGMVIAGMLSAKKVDYATYIRGRISRIYPAYLAAIVMSLVIMPVSVDVLNHMPFDTPQNHHRLRIVQATAENLAPHLVAHLTMLHGALPHNILRFVETAIIGQAWNISTEFQFYIFAPLILWVIEQRGRVQLTGAVSIIACVVAGRYYPNSANLGANALYFAIGIACYHLIIALRNESKHAWKIAITLGFIVALSREEIATGLWFGFLVLVLPKYLGIWKYRPLKILASPTMLVMGKLSYAIYLTHMIALYSVAWHLNHLNLSREAYFFLLLAGTTIVSVGLAYCVNRFIEEPVSRWERNPRVGKVA